MDRNVGGTDRIARLVVGPLAALAGLALVLGVVGSNTLAGAALFLVGAILTGTGLARQCLIYRVFGVDTCART